MKGHVVSGCISAAVGLFLASFSIHAADVDAKAAEKLAKKSACMGCHSVNKTKTGPSFQKVAAKYKGKADAEQTLVTFLTAGAKVKMADGSELDHSTIKSKDANEQKNVVRWILSQ